MTNHSLHILILLMVLGCGLMAGIFFAFSTFVMKALARIPSAQGIAAMQSINVTVINPFFMTVFLGNTLACITIVIFALFRWTEPGTGYLLIGALAYLIGSFVVTIIFHVPMNDALANLTPEGSNSKYQWERYIINWTTWNHVRTTASVTAATLFTFALTWY